VKTKQGKWHGQFVEHSSLMEVVEEVAMKQWASHCDELQVGEQFIAIHY